MNVKTAFSCQTDFTHFWVKGDFKSQQQLHILTRDVYAAGRLYCSAFLGCFSPFVSLSVYLYLRTRPGQCKHLAHSTACCLLRAMTDGKGAYGSNTSIFDRTGSCLPKIACTPRPYMCRPPACAWGGIMYLGHTIRAGGSLLLLTSRPIATTGTRPLFLSQDGSPCTSPSSTANVSSTFSPSWTRTVGGVCPSPVTSCVRSSWTPASGICSTSAPRVSWGGTTLCWDPHCATWLFAGTPAGSCKCATLRTGWRARFRRTSAVNMKAWSALSWPMSATCECLCVGFPLLCVLEWHLTKVFS